MVEGSRGLCLHFPALPAMSMDCIRKPNAGKVLNGPQCLSASVWDLYHTRPGHAPSFPQIRRACSPAVWAAMDLCSFLQLDPHTRKISKLISLHPNPSYLVLHSAILPRCPRSRSSLLGFHMSMWAIMAYRTIFL